MRTRQWLLSAGLCAALAGGAGCSGTKPGKTQSTAPAPGSAGTKPKAIVTPASALAGKVASVNPNYQFVVLAFEGGQKPLPDQRLTLYRAQLKVGEVKVSRQQMGRNVVADIVAGEARVGDEVRGE